MAGYLDNIEEKILENEYFRQVLFTGPHSRLVVMSIGPGEDIGMETHGDIDQFIRVEAGTGKAILNGQEHELGDGSAVVIPAGTEHNIVNSSPRRAARRRNAGTVATTSPISRGQSPASQVCRRRRPPNLPLRQPPEGCPPKLDQRQLAVALVEPRIP